ncbi:hypothetical protein AB0H20_14895 [Nocardia fluminea]|uniref:hypothetical protein n=1 Tax=Nocardia fluminea TaxID=134984 RepID=UPI0033EE0BED
MTETVAVTEQKPDPLGSLQYLVAVIFVGRLVGGDLWRLRRAVPLLGIRHWSRQLGTAPPVTLDFASTRISPTAVPLSFAIK